MQQTGVTATGLVLLALVLAGCGDEDGSAVTAAATTCAVDRDASGPLTTEAGALFVPPVAQPADWLEPPQEAFDWDADGAPDTLGFDQDAGAVVVTWADGSLIVTGIRSDFAGQPGQPVEPGGDPFLDQPTESGPPSPESVEEGLAAPIPAAVADVTGDGLLDLLVVDDGTASVVVGAGADSASVSVAQSDDRHRGRGLAQSPDRARGSRPARPSTNPPSPTTRPRSCPAGTSPATASPTG